jgi:hypothetical protein
MEDDGQIFEIEVCLAAMMRSLIEYPVACLLATVRFTANEWR